MSLKVCIKCGEKKNIEEDFAMHTSQRKHGPYRRNVCRLCERKQRKSHYNPLAIRGYNIKQRYGITLEERDRMIKEQSGKCANPFCDVVFSDIPEHQIHIDHDHVTGIIRGILCQICNQLEGLIATKEKARRLYGIIEYKRLHSLSIDMAETLSKV